MSESIKSHILSKSNQMKTTALVPITNEQALLIDELISASTQNTRPKRKIVQEESIRLIGKGK